MVAKAVIKKVGKYLKKVVTNPVKLKKKPKPRYAKKGSQQFLNRREQMAGVKAATIKAPIGTRRPGYIEGAVTGAAATGAAMTYQKGKKAKATSAKDKLKKAADKKIAADKKKKESYGKRAPKKDKNYGGR